MPYILKRTAFDSEFDREEVISHYYMVILDCLNTYEGRNAATFETFLFFSIRRIFKLYFEIEKPIVKKSTVLNFDNEIFDSVDDLNSYVKEYYDN